MRHHASTLASLSSVAMTPSCLPPPPCHCARLAPLATAPALGARPVAAPRLLVMARPPADQSRTGLRLMHVHAHPDDESSKGAASTAKYVAEGVDVHVATCTGGERGSILNPNMDRPDVLANIAEIRRQEMDTAREILGIKQDWLGWVDSGFPEGDPKPPLPEGCFALLDVEVAAEP